MPAQMVLKCPPRFVQGSRFNVKKAVICKELIPFTIVNNSSK